MTWRLSEPSAFSFDLDGRDPQAFAVTELATDVHLLRDGRPIFTGRVGSTSHHLDADGHTRSVSVADTRGLLNRRVTRRDRTYTDADAAVFATDMFADAQDGAGADLRIAAPALIPIGVPVTRTSSGGQPILKELSDTAGASTGASEAGPLFDWDITPGWLNRTFQLWKQRGADRGVFLDYTWSPTNPRSSNIADLTRDFDPSTYANSVYVTGGVKKVTVQQEVTSQSQPDPVEVSAPPAVATSSTGLVQRGTRDVAAQTATSPVSRGTRTLNSAAAPDVPTTQVSDATSPQYIDVTFEIPTTPINQTDGSLVWSVGVWATAEGYTDIVEQDELQAKAEARVKDLQQVTPTYKVTLVTDFWQGPDHIWLGDTVTVHIDSGSLYETASLRVTEVALTLSDDGAETVTLTVGAPVKQPYNAIVDATSRIASLERRR